MQSCASISFCFGFPSGSGLLGSNQSTATERKKLLVEPRVRVNIRSYDSNNESELT